MDNSTSGVDWLASDLWITPPAEPFDLIDWTCETTNCDNPYYLITYWKQRLCQSCCREAARRYDEIGRWPDGQIH